MNFLILNSWVAWFIPVITIPIIIHLIFKRQHRVVDWAAIQFLIEAEKRIRRKLKLIELFLLFLRCLIIGLLLFLFARFLFNNSIDFIPGQSHGHDHIFVIDNSPSLEIKEYGTSRLDTIKTNLKSYLKKISEKNNEHRATMMSMVNGQYFLKEKNIKENINEIENVIASLEINDAPVDYRKSLESIDKLKLERPKSFKSFYYISDFQEEFFKRNGVENNVVNFLKLSEKYDEMRLIDVVPPKEFANLSIEAVEVSSKQIVKDVPIKIFVKIKNNGTIVKRNVSVVLTKSKQLPLAKNIESLEQGQGAIVEFYYTFTNTGPQSIEISLPNDDDLESDNKYYLGINVLEGSRILIIDGDESIEPEDTNSYFISNAINPPGKQYSGNLFEIKSEKEFATLLINDYDIIYLCNNLQINQKMVEQLGAWVKNGGKLIISMGDQIDTNYYNENIFTTLNIPVEIKKLIYAGDQKYSKLHPLKTDGTSLSFFKGENVKFLDNTQFYYWYEVKLVGKNNNVQQVGEFQLGQNYPALLKVKNGEGDIVLFTSTLGTKWNNWASDFSFVIFNLELIRQGVKNIFEGLSVDAGSSMNFKASSQYYEPKSIFILMDNQHEAELLSDKNEGSLHEFYSPNQYKKGFFTLNLKSYDGLEKSYLGNINIDGKEGHLKQVDLKNTKLGDNERIHLDEISWFSKDGEIDQKDEIWKMLIVIIMFLLATETLFAWLFGRSR